MTTTTEYTTEDAIEDSIDHELEQTHARLVLDLVSGAGPKEVYILTPPPTDDPE